MFSLVAVSMISFCFNRREVFDIVFLLLVSSLSPYSPWICIIDMIYLGQTLTLRCLVIRYWWVEVEYPKNLFITVLVSYLIYHVLLAFFLQKVVLFSLPKRAVFIKKLALDQDDCEQLVLKGATDCVHMVKPLVHQLSQLLMEFQLEDAD
ncbi:hypothetical protein AHF37_11454 [Paragonimus kellicotti]|nr:hypothetical protein AHF37_11454 [Paragonimus kellicotti]